MRTESGVPRQRLLARLKRVPLFAGLPPHDLQTLASAATRLRVRAGDTVMREGDAADGLYVLLRGRLQVTRRAGAEEVLLARQRPGSYVGEMALLGSAPRNATVRATRDSVLLRVEASCFRTLLAAHPQTTLRVLRGMGRRLARTEAALVRREALASLGTIAAGLAHELNNPAAAIAASAARLRSRAAQLEERAALLGAPVLADRAAAARAARAAGGAGRPTAEEEASLLAWLRACRVAGPAAAAHALRSCGWTAGRLNDLTAGLGDDDRRRLVAWLEARCEVASLTDELTAAAQSISGIVDAVRAHVSCAAVPLAPVDVRETIEAALVVLRPRWTQRVRVSVAGPTAGPRVLGHRGELIQVWSNLIGNAIEAGAGRVRVRLRPRAAHTLIDVHDDGPGIEPAARRRIFDPFFTTKGAAGGTGLGLHIVRTIVLQRHGGRIAVRSQPGHTIFRVILPAAEDAPLR